MRIEEITKNMRSAILEDRERFFKIADSMRYTSKYADKADEVEKLRQQWRDITALIDYPNINHPLPLPDWFPKVPFASSFQRDEQYKAISDDEYYDATTDPFLEKGGNNG